MSFTPYFLHCDRTRSFTVRTFDLCPKLKRPVAFVDFNTRCIGSLEEIGRAVLPINFRVSDPPNRSSLRNRSTPSLQANFICEERFDMSDGIILIYSAVKETPFPIGEIVISRATRQSDFRTLTKTKYHRSSPPSRNFTPSFRPTLREAESRRAPFRICDLPSLIIQNPKAW